MLMELGRPLEGHLLESVVLKRDEGGGGEGNGLYWFINMWGWS